MDYNSKAFDYSRSLLEDLTDPNARGQANNARKPEYIVTLLTAIHKEAIKYNIYVLNLDEQEDRTIYENILNNPNKSIVEAQDNFAVFEQRDEGSSLKYTYYKKVITVVMTDTKRLVEESVDALVSYLHLNSKTLNFNTVMAYMSMISRDTIIIPKSKELLLSSYISKKIEELEKLEKEKENEEDLLFKNTVNKEEEK